MSTEQQSYLTIAEMQIEVVRKAIKNLHLGVYPPAGRVRVAVPLAVSDDAVRLAVIRKLSWIRRKQADFAAQQRQSVREMVSGESHYVWGRRYRLRVIERQGPIKIRLSGTATLELAAPAGSSVDERHAGLQRWYRAQLRERLVGLLEHWQQVIGVQPSAWVIRRMKTKWGGCNTETGRLTFNLELAKKSPRCLEYIVVHELIHLLERRHNERFRSLLTQYLPQWQLLRDELNSAPLGHEEWRY